MEKTMSLINFKTADHEGMRAMEIKLLERRKRGRPEKMVKQSKG